jgi:hypothetical protein
MPKDKSRMKLLMVLLFTIVLLGAGCFESKTNTIEGQPESGGIKISDNTYDYKDEETGASASVGANAKIPADFPSDVPLYNNAKIMAASVIPNQGATILYTTSDSPEDVASWYENELVSDQWTKETDSNFNGRLMKVFRKGEVMISIAVSEIENETSVTVIRAIK